MTTINKKLVPPDGGYGWVIVSAYALHHLIIIPIGDTFGLIFKDKFKDLNFSATDITLIMNTNVACSYWFGIINGALLKKLGYRKVSALGATLMTIGILMMSYANTFTQFMISYGIITAIGMGMGLTSYPLALNSYFTKNRTKAFGYAMTIVGFGPAIIPQLISILLGIYGIKGSVMILSGIAAHAFVSAILLQPVKHHMKEEIIEEDLNEIENKALLKKGRRKAKRIDRGLRIEEEMGSTYSINTHLSGSVLSLYVGSTLSLSQSKSQLKGSKITKTVRIADESTLHEENEMPDVKVVSEKEYDKNANINETERASSDGSTTEKGTQEAVGCLGRIGNCVVNLFDLTLLKDLTFVNIIVGISVGVFSERNFAMLIPFIMQEYNLSTQEIATFMSMHSIADICFRFVAPYVNKLLKKPVRVMYLWTLVLLILFRFGLMATSNYIALLTCAALIGLARGFRTIYWILILPSYVPVDRLASATGLQSITSGTLICLGAPFLGFLKDLTGSFRMCISVINFMTFLSIIMWVTEFTYKRCKSKKAATDTDEVK